jgi:hypothetical protein
MEKVAAKSTRKMHEVCAMKSVLQILLLYKKKWGSTLRL